MDVTKRLAAHKDSPCQFLLIFERTFVLGPLVNLVHEDDLPFTSVEAADQWVRSVNARPDCDYRVTQHIVLPIRGWQYKLVEVSASNTTERTVESFSDFSLASQERTLMAAHYPGRLFALRTVAA
jgi:hypothetical protein